MTTRDMSSDSSAGPDEHLSPDSVSQNGLSLSRDSLKRHDLTRPVIASDHALHVISSVREW
jgi:hypothetical protein